jgi:type II secretion system protein N
VAVRGRSKGRAGGSGPIGTTGIALACLLLTLFFLFLGFPFDRLGQRLTADLNRRSGAQVSFQELGSFLSLAGPGLEARGVQITTAAGIRVPLERARLRPAWSLAWLRLSPAVHVDLEGPSGSIVGVVWLGTAPGFAGDLAGIELGRIPANLIWPGAVLTGTLDAAVDLRSSPSGPEGSVALSARNGNVGVADYPVSVPFEELTGTLRFGGDHLLELNSFETTSPLFSATASGHIAQAPSFGQAPVDVEVQIEAKPRFRSTLRSAGIHLSREGHATLHIRGTPSAPEVR